MESLVWLSRTIIPDQFGNIRKIYIGYNERTNHKEIIMNAVLAAGKRIKWKAIGQGIAKGGLTLVLSALVATIADKAVDAVWKPEMDGVPETNPES